MPRGAPTTGHALRTTVARPWLVLFCASLALALGPASAAGRSTLFVAPDGSDARNCSRAAPCASFARAYRKARPGDTVKVAGGTYPPQILTRDTSKASGRKVAFRPARRAAVTLRGLKFGTGVASSDGPRGISIRRMRVQDSSGRQAPVSAFAGSADLLWRDVDAAGFYVNEVRRLRIDGGDWGPCRSSGNFTTDGCTNSKIDGPGNDRITIDGARFHDYRIVPGSGAHFECLFLAGGTRITVKNSRFDGCEYYDIFIQYHGAPFDGLRLLRNRFGAPYDGRGTANRVSGVSFSGRGYHWRDVRVERNSFETGIEPDDGGGAGWERFRIARNIGALSQGCQTPGVQFTANVWRRGACGARDLSAPFGYEVQDGSLARSPKAATVVRRIFAARLRGRPARAIARALRHRRATAPAGGWTGARVSAVLRNRAYRGGLFGVPGAHPPLVSRVAWRGAQR